MKTIYPVARTVSVWIGSFRTESEFDVRVDELNRELQLEVPIESICEVTFQAELTPIRDILNGFSGWETFCEAAVQSASALGIHQANSALVCYYLKCEKESQKVRDLSFLGSFVGQDNI